MKLASYRRLNKNDYKEEYQPLVEQLSYSLNNAIEGILGALNGNITFGDNIAASIKEFTIKKGETAKVAVGSNTKVNGLIVINALADDNTAPESAVFCSFVQKDSTIEITSITGLPDNKKFTVKVLIL